MNPPRLPSFFKKTEHKAFRFTPRYYDESKERVKQSYERVSKKRSEKNNSITYTQKNRVRHNRLPKIILYTGIICGILYYMFVK